MNRTVVLMGIVVCCFNAYAASSSNKVERAPLLNTVKELDYFEIVKNKNNQSKQEYYVAGQQFDRNGKIAYIMFAVAKRKKTARLLHDSWSKFHNLKLDDELKFGSEVNIMNRQRALYDVMRRNHLHKFTDKELKDPRTHDVRFMLIQIGKSHYNAHSYLHYAVTQHREHGASPAYDIRETNQENLFDTKMQPRRLINEWIVDTDSQNLIFSLSHGRICQLEPNLAGIYEKRNLSLSHDDIFKRHLDEKAVLIVKVASIIAHINKKRNKRGNHKKKILRSFSAL